MYGNDKHDTSNERSCYVGMYEMSYTYLHV